MSEENEGQKDDNDFRHQFDNSAPLIFSSIELSYLRISVFNLFYVMYIQERITRSKRSYRIRKSETVAQDGWLLILVACTLSTLKVFRIGANGCRSFIYSHVSKQVSTHCPGSAFSNNPIFRIYPR